MSKILIAGGTGLIGQRLSKLLKSKGHQVQHLSRTENLTAEFPAFGWNIDAGTYNPNAVVDLDYVINLAGAGIADKRWSIERKKIIIDSRVKSTLLLGQMIKASGVVKAFIGGTAIGYYGNRGDNVLFEGDAPGTGFLTDVVNIWEQTIDTVSEQTAVRTVIIRTGIVLSMQNGALPKMLLPLKAFVSPYFGAGKSWYSWIHIDDLCSLIFHCLKTESVTGIYNGVAPHPIPQKIFAEKLIETSSKTAFCIPTPSWSIKLALGEMAATVLDSTRCSAKKIQDTGFSFDFPTLDDALKNLLK